MENLGEMEDLGYQVSTFRAPWTLPPTGLLRLGSTALTDPGKPEAITAKATGAISMGAVVSSAAEAQRNRSSMKLGTTTIDVDFTPAPYRGDTKCR